MEEKPINKNNVTLAITVIFLVIASVAFGILWMNERMLRQSSVETIKSEQVYTVRNESSVSVDLGLEVVYQIVQGQEYTITFADLLNRIQTLSRPYFIGSSIDFVYDNATKQEFPFSILIFNPLPQDIEIVFGIESAHPELYTLPPADILESKEYRLYDFKFTLDQGESSYYITYQGRLFFDYYVNGQDNPRVYYGEGQN